jgi:pimeloyl-ACP methyl ester carboxylesterase
MPETKYAKSGDIHIAYQVTGSGPLDLVWVPGFVSHLEYHWESPELARFTNRLAAFSRLIRFDKRGTGLSDRVSAPPTLEQRMDDVKTVMDAVGSERAALFGISEGGPMSLLFAATYPARTTALVIYGSYARRSWAPDHPWGLRDEQWETLFRTMESEWGGPMGLARWAPSAAHDERFKQWWATYLRLAASPGAALAVMRLNREIDVRPVLPAIRVPTLVLHRTGDQLTQVEQARYMATRIPGAKVCGTSGR